jgi:hypothetical protein
LASPPIDPRKYAPDDYKESDGRNKKDCPDERPVLKMEDSTRDMVKRPDRRTTANFMITPRPR